MEEADLEGQEKEGAGNASHGGEQGDEKGDEGGQEDPGFHTGDRKVNVQEIHRPHARAVLEDRGTIEETRIVCQEEAGSATHPYIRYRPCEAALARQ